jgi:hypothetical protein
MLIPLLDQGSAGLAKMREEAERLGLVLSGKDAAAMERLSDQFKNLGEGSKGVMQTLLAGLAPELSKLFDAIYRLYEPLINTGEGLEYVRAIGSGLGGLIEILAIGFDLLATGIGLAVDKLSLFVGGIGAMASGQFSAGVEKLKQLVGLSEDARAELLLAEHSEFTKSVLGPGTPASLKKTGSGDLAHPQKDADKLAQQLLKNRLDRERAGVEFEKALGSEQQQRLDELLKHELISYSDYYDQRKQLSIATAQAEYDSLSRQASLTLDAVGKIKDATKRAGLQDEYFKLTAQQDLALQKLRSLQGLTPGGQIDAQAAQLDAMNRAAGMAGQVGRQVDTVFSDLQTRSERVQFLVSTRQITELEGEKQLNQIRGQAADRLRDMVTQYQAMAEASGDPKLIENGKRMGEQIDELAHKTSMLRESVIDAAQNGLRISSTRLSPAPAALAGPSRMATSVLGDIGRIISKMLAMYAVEKLVGLFLGAVSGGKRGTISDTGLNPPLGGSGVTNAAGGADVEAGQPLFVGETGEPELFVPHQSGTIVPQHRLATMGGATFIYEIDARGATPGRARAHALGAAADGRARRCPLPRRRRPDAAEALMAISYPISLPASASPRIVTIKGACESSITESPFTAEQQVQSYPVDRWQAEIEYPIFDRAGGEQLLSRLLSLYGASGVFYLGDDNGATPRGVATGTPFVSGPGNQARILLVAAVPRASPAG